MSLLIIFLSIVAFSEERVIYQYKDYEKIDLGDFSIQGDIITPGDLSVKDRKLKFINGEIFEREDFEDLSHRDLQARQP